MHTVGPATPPSAEMVASDCGIQTEIANWSESQRFGQDLSSLEESRLAGWGGPSSQASVDRIAIPSVGFASCQRLRRAGLPSTSERPTDTSQGFEACKYRPAWREVVLREEHLRLTAEARIETACCSCLSGIAYLRCFLSLERVRCDQARNMLWHRNFLR